MNHPVTKTFLALIGAGTLAATASAQVTTYTPGDLLLGFREFGSTNSVVVDLGQYTNFSTSMTFPVNAGSTLAAQYGSNWASNSNVFFSLASTSSTDRTNYVTSPEYSTGPNAGPATIWSRMTNTNATIFQNKINSFGGEFTSRYATSPTLPEVQPSSDPNAYQNYMPGGTTDATHATSANIAWGYFNPTSEGNFDQGTSGVALDLIQLPPGSPGTPGNDLGTFQLSSDGNTLSFTTNVVPEPSGYVTMGVWGALALLCFQMNKCRKSSTKEQSA